MQAGVASLVRNLKSGEWMPVDHQRAARSNPRRTAPELDQIRCIRDALSSSVDAATSSMPRCPEIVETTATARLPDSRVVYRSAAGR